MHHASWADVLFLHTLKQSIRSLQHNVLNTLLMVLAMGLGIGAAMTSVTVFRAISTNPMAHKEGRLLIPQVDNWELGSPYAEHGEPPKQLTYQDAVALWQAQKATRQALIYPNELVVQDAEGRLPSSKVKTLLTTSDFFSMFEAPLLFGAGWDKAADELGKHVVVISRALNLKLNGDQNSVGQHLRIAGEDFTVVGVLDEWHPQLKVYDFNFDTLDDVEDIYVPFQFGIQRQLRSTNNDCWPSFAGDYEAFKKSECVWINLWIEVDSALQAASYRQFVDEYVTAEKARGRFSKEQNNRLRTVGEWLEARHAVRDDVRLQTLLSFGFLVVCLINTIGLLLAKFLSHTKEISVYRALGATRRQIFLRFMSEAALIGACGSILGLLMTFGGTGAMRALDPTLSRAAHMDVSMVAATIVIALVAALVAGAFPAWRACRTQPAAFLKSE